jgi:hypothetical protein
MSPEVVPRRTGAGSYTVFTARAGVPAARSRYGTPFHNRSDCLKSDGVV